MDWLGAIFIAAAIVSLLLPPTSDPMIRWKERLERWDRKEGDQ